MFNEEKKHEIGRRMPIAMRKPILYLVDEIGEVVQAAIEALRAELIALIDERLAAMEPKAPEEPKKKAKKSDD